MSEAEIPRRELVERVRLALGRNPVTALIGPRQCGKTTLARQLAAQQPTEYFDLEAPSDLERLAHPMTALEPSHHSFQYSGRIRINSPITRLTADHRWRVPDPGLAVHRDLVSDNLVSDHRLGRTSGLGSRPW